MKDLIQYLKLWQKKRNELPVDRDADSDWLDMSALLDEHMPVNNDSDGSSPKKGISLFSIMLIALSAAAMFYVAHTVIETKKQTAQQKHKLHHKKRGSSSGTDSSATSDSLDQGKDQIVKSDSISTSRNVVTSSTTSANVPNKDNGSASVNTGTINSKAQSMQANGDKRTGAAVNTQNATLSATLSHSSDNNRLNLPGAAIKEKGSPQASLQNQRLLLNSALLTNKLNDDRNPISLNPRGDARNNTATKARDNKADNADDLILLPWPVSQGIVASQGLINSYPTLNDKTLFQTSNADASKNGKTRNKPALHINLSVLDWGILVGANSNGSFTSGNLNRNFYGSLPVDIFTGIYGTYNLNTQWGIGTQVALLSPQIAKGGTYSRPYLFYTDSNVTTKHKLVSNPKKIYSIQLPVYATYKVAQNINLKAGPVVSFPIKQSNAIQADSISRDLINHSHYDQKIDFSFAGGINYQYKQLIFEANYLKGLKQHSIISDSLIHRSTNNTFQFSIKLQLGGKKK